MRTPLAVAVACLALCLPAFALAATTDNSTATTSTATQTQQPSCTPLKQVYAESRWRESKPAQGYTVCPVANSAKARNTVHHFYEYRHYRRITPYRCLPGREGTFAIPCYIIQCESNFNWWARNPSGALWIYQLLGWGAPAPTSFHNRLRNHEIAASLSLSNWSCA